GAAGPPDADDDPLLPPGMSRARWRAVLEGRAEAATPDGRTAGEAAWHLGESLRLVRAALRLHRGCTAEDCDLCYELTGVEYLLGLCEGTFEGAVPWGLLELRRLNKGGAA